ncbi:DinB family protein [Alkalihalobacillus sp. LMS39]|uniref:DinB family protein n=1 Tax=Alkalihalobacillus sp. LMS39 TaxID=2924032 RepID=UPI001FB21BA0|nr:DinB family protein [Alkalihalobacillus sp. LMS39]UOE95852.1 DinB family protein [Alkalihalobacillus sp. LMS39]
MNKTLQQFQVTIEEVIQFQDMNEELLCEPLSVGKWSIREIIGHLYYWDKFNLELMVPYMQDGNDLPPFPNHDELNHEGIRMLKDHSVKDIITLFISTRKELITQISTIDENVRFTIGGGKRKLSTESFVKIFLKHDSHHLKQMREKVKSG